MRKFLFFAMLMVETSAMAQIWKNYDVNKDGEVDVADITCLAEYILDPYVGFDAVDLALPSGTKWATCNVGAEHFWEPGYYLSWGETEPKTSYFWTNYKWSGDSDYKYTKYSSKEKYGIIDNKMVLELDDDAAHVHMKGLWRMPTTEELNELINNCEVVWGNFGTEMFCAKFISKINGAYIFIPASGYKYHDKTGNYNSLGYLWSASLEELGTNNGVSEFIFWENNEAIIFQDCRYEGIPVRGVCK